MYRGAPEGPFHGPWQKHEDTEVFYLRHILRDEFKWITRAQLAHPGVQLWYWKFKPGFSNVAEAELTAHWPFNVQQAISDGHYLSAIEWAVELNDGTFHPRWVSETKYRLIEVYYALSKGTDIAINGEEVVANVKKYEDIIRYLSYALEILRKYRVNPSELWNHLRWIRPASLIRKDIRELLEWYKLFPHDTIATSPLVRSGGYVYTIGLLLDELLPQLKTLPDTQDGKMFFGTFYIYQ